MTNQTQFDALYEARERGANDGQIRQLAQNLPWEFIEWEGPNEEIVNGLDGTFQVFLGDGLQEIWLFDVASAREGKALVRAHNRKVTA